MLSSQPTNHLLADDTIRLATDTWQPQPSKPQKEYYLLWRAGWSHPWRSEEIDNRNVAHARYFDLIERGYEAYLERRQGKLTGPYSRHNRDRAAARNDLNLADGPVARRCQ